MVFLRLVQKSTHKKYYLPIFIPVSAIANYCTVLVILISKQKKSRAKSAIYLKISKTGVCTWKLRFLSPLVFSMTAFALSGVLPHSEANLCASSSSSCAFARAGLYAALAKKPFSLEKTSRYNRSASDSSPAKRCSSVGLINNTGDQRQGGKGDY